MWVEVSKKRKTRRRKNLLTNTINEPSDKIDLTIQIKRPLSLEQNKIEVSEVGPIKYVDGEYLWERKPKLWQGYEFVIPYSYLYLTLVKYFY